MTDVRTIIVIHINTARIEVPFMWGSLRLAPITVVAWLEDYFLRMKIYLKVITVVG